MGFLEAGMELGLEKSISWKSGYRRRNDWFSSNPHIWAALFRPPQPSQDTGEWCSGEFKWGRLQTLGTDIAEHGNEWPQGAVKSTAWVTRHVHSSILLSPYTLMAMIQISQNRATENDIHFHSLFWPLIFQLWGRKWKRFNLTCWLPLSLRVALSSWHLAKGLGAVNLLNE